MESSAGIMAVFPFLFFSIFFFVYLCFVGIMLLVSIISFVIWIWALIDAISRDPQDFPPILKDPKLFWIIILFVTGVVGPILYYFMVYKEVPRKK